MPFLRSPLLATAQTQLMVLHTVQVILTPPLEPPVQPGPSESLPTTPLFQVPSDPDPSLRPNARQLQVLYKQMNSEKPHGL